MLAIGEAESTAKPVGDGELNRLEHLREILSADKDDSQAILLLFSRTGFTRELHATATARPDVELIDLHRLYHGD